MVYVVPHFVTFKFHDKCNNIEPMRAQESTRVRHRFEKNPPSAGPWMLHLIRI